MKPQMNADEHRTDRKRQFIFNLRLSAFICGSVAHRAACMHEYARGGIFGIGAPMIRLESEPLIEKTN
jgi:hypothetical protein